MEKTGKIKKRALISVFNKQGITSLASFLAASGWEILSTGGTFRYLQEAGIPVMDVSDVTGFPECLGGRVKTLHPAIHTGLLAKRADPAHWEALEKAGFAPIDLVCVNLYPFFEKVQARLSQEETLEFIDIGGAALLRSAAKNYQDVIVLTDPADYPGIITALSAGDLPQDRRKTLAAKVFTLTSAYDGAVARYLLDEPAPAYWPLSLKKAQTLRYGENYHQSATLYCNTDKPGAFASMKQLSGKELSYNNIRDLDLAWKVVCAFGLPADGTPPLGEADLIGIVPAFPKLPPVCCVAVKHNTPCGIALGTSLIEAYTKAYNCDPVSIFGGILGCNAVVDVSTAVKLAELFLEIIVAPDFDDEALAILKCKKNLRIMQAPFSPRQTQEFVSVDGGLLVQDTDQKLLEKWNPVTKLAPEAEDIADMIFGMRAVQYVKSNAVLVVKNRAALGIGAGETNRIWAAELALNRAHQVIVTTAAAGVDNGEPPRVLASDAFFPFPDVIEVAAAAGIKTIIQPGGSQNDQPSIETCDRLGLAMVFTGTRHFKH
ncbi:MAG: bifunctional phosphoribosylaminoimidazolecarboxamide formyltransferase/IMP cyclohydrolase [Treponema sp.]|jgi:phosphoribosylaminoimidazolecarboxamide formyltransferase/IMP cyclohydrolase|nr:bifunctional phosphoribosylaminoimidazolecarboxamide formyltransferase/IMP cyclohydrolase [Treponema sp.]